MAWREKARLMAGRVSVVGSGLLPYHRDERPHHKDGESEATRDDNQCQVEPYEPEGLHPTPLIAAATCAPYSPPMASANMAHCSRIAATGSTFAGRLRSASLRVVCARMPSMSRFASPSLILSRCIRPRCVRIGSEPSSRTAISVNSGTDRQYSMAKSSRIFTLLIPLWLMPNSFAAATCVLLGSASIHAIAFDVLLVLRIAISILLVGWCIALYRN